MASGRDFLGPFRLVKLIRAGNSCQVWEAVNDPDPRRVALKVLLEEHRKNREEIRQLRNEAECGIGLDHKNVIKIFEFTTAYHLPFLAMELFNARNLKQELRERPEILAYRATEVIEGCARGLGHFNDKGFIHCDVKPDNFLVSAVGEVKLIDFSIAQKPRTGLGGLFKSKKAIQGTRSYMSPEQIRGKKLDARSDMYGFGCVLFELLSGKPPFTAVSADDLLRKHLTNAAPSAAVYNSRVSAELSSLIQRMLSKEKEKRPESFLAFLQEFKTISTYKAGQRPAKPEQESADI